MQKQQLFLNIIFKLIHLKGKIKIHLRIINLIRVILWNVVRIFSFHIISIFSWIKFLLFFLDFSIFYRLHIFNKRALSDRTAESIYLPLISFKMTTHLVDVQAFLLILILVFSLDFFYFFLKLSVLNFTRLGSTHFMTWRV